MSGWLQTVKQLRSSGGIEGFFAVKYAEWAEGSQEMREEYRRLAAEAASEVQAGKALEIGPGPGYVSIEMAKLLPETEIVGLDLSDIMIELALRNATQHGVSERVKFRKGDASDMPFEDSSFDLVVSSGSLHHWKEPHQAFEEIHRVLKPGGKALISDVRKDADEEKIEGFARTIDSRIMRWGLRHSFAESYSPQQIEEMIRNTPFGPARIELKDISMEIWLHKEA